MYTVGNLSVQCYMVVCAQSIRQGRFRATRFLCDLSLYERMENTCAMNETSNVCIHGAILTDPYEILCIRAIEEAVWIDFIISYISY